MKHASAIHGRNLLLAAVPLLGLLAVWQLSTSYYASIYFPTPTAIATRSLELWTSADQRQMFLGDVVFTDILPSVGRLLLGWMIGGIVGIGAGFLIGGYKTVSDFIDPVLQFLRAIPGPALVPVFIVLFGTGTSMRVALIAFGSLWPVLLNTIEAARTVDEVKIATAKVLRLPPLARFLRIVVPASLPKLFAGLRVSLSLAVILMVVSELVASTNGIGHSIQTAQMMFLLTDVWSGILLLALIGSGLNAVFVAIEARALKWHAGSKGRSP